MEKLKKLVCYQIIITQLQPTTNQNWLTLYNPEEYRTLLWIELQQSTAVNEQIDFFYYLISSANLFLVTSSH